MRPPQSIQRGLSLIRAYRRVSTAEQADSGLGLDAQAEAIRLWCFRQAKGGNVMYEDHASGGKMANRPGLQQALADMQRGDTLVVAKLDRLARSLLDTVTMLEASRKQHWTLVALDIGLDTSTAAGEAMFGMMAVWAQLERRMISQRVKDAMAQIKTRGTKSGKPVGRPRTVDPKIASECRFLRSVQGWSYPKIAASLGLPWTTVQRICQRATSVDTTASSSLSLGGPVRAP